MKTFLLLVLLSFVGACQPQQGDSNSSTTLTEPQNGLSEELMLSLGQAQNFHHKADVYLSDGKLELAAGELERILAVPFPKDAPEAQDVLLDARARLGKLRIRQTRMGEAMTLVDEGISMASRDSFFLANLHTVRGEVFEALATQSEPDSDESRTNKIEAIKAFDRSIQINEVLLENLKAKGRQ